MCRRWGKPSEVNSFIQRNFPENLRHSLSGPNCHRVHPVEVRLAATNPISANCLLSDRLARAEATLFGLVAYTIQPNEYEHN